MIFHQWDGLSEMVINPFWKKPYRRSSTMMPFPWDLIEKWKVRENTAHWRCLFNGRNFLTHTTATL